MKTCTLCNQTKDYSEFTKHAQKKDGYSSWCKPCKREKDKLATAKRKKAKAEYDKQYRKDNIEKIKSNSEAYRSTRKKAKAEYDKQYRAEKGQERLKQKRDYYHNGNGKEMAKQWRINNPDKVKANDHNTGAKRRELIKSSTLTSTDIKTWSEEQPKLCTYCGKLCNDSYQIDHIEPLAKGGAHSIENLTITCTTCNQSKGAKQLIYWMAVKSTDRS